LIASCVIDLVRPKRDDDLSGSVASVAAGRVRECEGSGKRASSAAAWACYAARGRDAVDTDDGGVGSRTIATTELGGITNDASLRFHFRFDLHGIFGSSQKNTILRDGDGFIHAHIAPCLSYPKASACLIRRTAPLPNLAVTDNGDDATWFAEEFMVFESKVRRV